MKCVVEIPSALRDHCGGALHVEVEAGTVRQVLRRLEARFPGFGERLGTEFAVAIDGEIHPDPWLEPVPPGGELHFLPPLAGGAGEGDGEEGP